MPTYQKAYRLGMLRRFPAWRERPPAAEDGGGEHDALENDTIVFLHEDLRVTLTCFDDAEVIFDDVTPQWRGYCREDLAFAVPDWEAEARAVREALGEADSDAGEA